MTDNKKVIVIIPCYNEENNLITLISELRDVAKKTGNLFFLFVNDCSTDNTENILREAAMDYMNHPVNLGYNYAVQTGLKYGLESGYSYFIILDGDGQHPPKEIEKFINTFDEETDLLIGSRFRDGFKSTYDIHLVRKLGMIFFSFVTSLLIGSKIKDTTSGYQMFNSSVARALLYIYEAEFPDAEVIYFLKLLKFKIREIPVEMRMRVSGESMISRLSALYYPVRVLSGLFFAFGRYINYKEKNRK